MRNDRPVLEALSAAIEAGRPVAQATIVETRRSVPRHSGTKMLVFEDGSTVGTVGGGAMEASVIEEARRALLDRSTRFLDYDLVNPAKGDPGICGGTVAIYVEPFMPPHSVYVIGCGHVGRSVVELAHWLGYRTIAIDDRADAVSEAALPSADVRFHGSVAAALEAHPVPTDASIVVVTRSPDIDATVLPSLIETPARYIGVMGSATRWKATRDQVMAAGVAPEDLEKVHSPIGIEVEAETLEEIAVSIMSEVIMVNRTSEER